MSVTIKIGNIERTLAGVKELDKPTLLALAQTTYDEASRGAARHNKTGALLQSLYNRATATGRAVGHDTARAPHAEFVLLGSRPHEIRPKNKKALRWPVGSKFRFAKLVRHPGYIGDPYLFAAGDAALRQFDAIVNKAFGELT